MVNHEVDRAVKQACFLCPPTQYFAQCVYQMAALYQGVADIGNTQSPVKQEYGSPGSNNWGAVTKLISLPTTSLLSLSFCTLTPTVNGAFTAISVLMTTLTRLSGDFFLVNSVVCEMCNDTYDRVQW